MICQLLLGIWKACPYCNTQVVEVRWGADLREDLGLVYEFSEHQSPDGL